MPTPHFERSTLTEREKEKRGDDVFKPPYNPNLYVGELRDEDEGTEYVVLVSEFGFLAIWELLGGEMRTNIPLRLLSCTYTRRPIIALDACFL